MAGDSWLERNIINPLVAQLAPVVVGAVSGAVQQLLPEVVAAITSSVEREIPKVVDAVVQAVTSVGVDLSQDSVNRLTDIIPGDLDNQIADAVFARIRDLLPHFPGFG